MKYLKKGNKIVAALLAVVCMLGVLIGVNIQTVQAKETEDLGYYYVAKGQPFIFRDSEAKSLKMVSNKGNPCKVSKNKVTVTCKKSGEITYKINGKYKTFMLYVGGNYPDSKVNKKEYDLPYKMEYNKKKYGNFVDIASHAKDTGLECYMSDKAELKKYKKFNRGITYGSTLSDVQEKYPSWEDVGTYGDDMCCWTSVYYDKKSGWVFNKGFVLDSKDKVKAIVYSAYDAKQNIMEL